ncbi:MAG: phosphoglycerate kinase [Candidatus Dasytiphilus stammeri]
MSIIKMSDLNLANKRVLIRVDLNVPMINGIVTSDARILAILPTINLARKKGAFIMILSHLGRPMEGEYNADFSLLPIANILKKYIGSIRFESNYLEGLNFTKDEIVLLENVRFNKGEKKNDSQLAKKYAALCDIFVMDAFATCHRTHASTYGVSKFAPIACAGPLLVAELNALTQAIKKPKRPMIAVLGGSKVSTKFDILTSLAKVADKVIVGGGIANTFLAIDNKVGQSLYEPNFIEAAKILRDTYNILTPVDVRVGKEFTETAGAIVKKISDIEDDEEIMDFGDATIQLMENSLKKAKTVIWNGPVGVFEFPNFRKGTETIAKAIANNNIFSIVGGGDTIAAIELFGLINKISYLSTGGAAFLSFVEGKELPSIIILKERAQQHHLNLTNDNLL